MSAHLALLAYLAIFPYIEVPFDPTVTMYDHVQRVGGEIEYDEGSPSGGRWVGNDYFILQTNTWTIPNCLETGFMFEVRFDNVPDDLEYFDVNITFPRMQLPQGGSKESIRRRDPVDVYGNSAYYMFGYYFDHEFERGLGDWVIEIEHQGELLYTATFTVVDCSEASEN